MKLEQSFSVEAPAEAVWAALTDVARVAPCLPGAEVTEVDDDGTYRGTFKVKLGPTSAEYRGAMRFEELDEATYTATMRADGQDKRGQGGAKARIVSRLFEHDGGTRVDVDTDFTITGRLARFGRGGMIQDVSQRLLDEFASCLQTQLAAPAAEPGPEPVPAGEVASVEAPPAEGEGKAPGEVPPPAGKAPGEVPPPPASAPLDAGQLVGGLVAERARDAAPLIVLAFLLGLLLGRRRG